jgi:calcineurin-like phosphoesterase family protein
MSIFFCSDHHFGHDKILTFYNYNGEKTRVFDDINSMNETIIYNHNSVVKKSDDVYFLGDVAIELNSLNLLSRMNGKKKLIRGNHDIFHISHYLKYFDEILATATFVGDFILSHIPIHPNCISKSYVSNVHGHLHSNIIKDKRYFNVSLEQIEFTPIEYSEILKKIK